ncbi:glutathione S-transferase U2-like [Ziziphus jujuba]|uniref:Glutathione S-transferase U2-like n=1 Tax=Ziziphus jujuba TaxID=326968 RepID=A0ABM4A2L7_ZIZJJ|nr:glutathione S-transferase U2-like [Ziziphus jujuba]
MKRSVPYEKATHLTANSFSPNPKLFKVWKHYPLLPHGPLEKDIARALAKFADQKLITEVWEAFKMEGEKKEKAIKAAVESLAIVVEKQIEGRIFSGETKYGI